MSEEDDLPQPAPNAETQMMTPPTGGASILPTSPAPLREVIGDFEVLGKLGAGGMGAVYRARQISLGRMVALKVLPAQFIEDADSVARFQREARVAASLSHAHLVKVYAAGEAEGCHYIAMELIEGEDLGQRIKRDGRLPAPEALRIIADVARGLQYGWQSAHLVHRDIKPGNIFLAADGVVKLGDLGLAKSVLGNTTGLTQTGTMMGTPHYISPEQARGDREIDFRADIYSLGCTLYQMLTGQVPYGGTEAITIIRQHLDAPLPAILKVWPQCPITLARLVGKMLKKSRHERHASYEELIAQIEQIEAQLDPARTPAPSAAEVVGQAPRLPGESSTARPSTAAGAAARQTVPPTTKKSKLPLFASLGAVVVVLGVVAFLLRPKAREEKLTKAQLVAQQRAADEKANVGTPNAATKDAPFVNSLGMKFVPVPITGGPTNGQRVLFSIWETRAQDYAAFAQATQRKWPKPSPEKTRTHPAVEVTWHDATAFCAWLTDRERSAGKLRATEVYRLPSDHEWSCAVGLGEREDAVKSPQAKNNGVPSVYPWGTTYPPPPKVGNYGGLEHEPGTGAIQAERERLGYRDDFPRSAPVGSFPPNALGIFDLGGNVWEWCADWAEPEQEHRVLRGASYENLGPAQLLLSSWRGDSYGPTALQPYIGFRVVLAPADSSATGPATSPPADTLTFGGHRYQLLPKLRTWAEAKAQAEALGGHLATINSKEESSFIRDRIVPKLPALAEKPSSRRLLLGGSREPGGAAWQWVTGEPFDPTLWVGTPPEAAPPGSTRYLTWDFGEKKWEPVGATWAAFPLIEWDFLGTPSADSPTPSSTTAPAITGWNDVMPYVRAEFAKTAAGREEDGWLVAATQEKTTTLLMDGVTRKDYAIRGRYRTAVQLNLRQLAGNYLVVLLREGKTSDIRSTDGKIAELTVPAGKEHDFLVTYRGDTVSVWVDGAFAGSAKEARHTEGRTWFVFLERDSAVRDLAIADLPPTTAANIPPYFDWVTTKRKAKGLPASLVDEGTHLRAIGSAGHFQNATPDAAIRATWAPISKGILNLRGTSGRSYRVVIGTTIQVQDFSVSSNRGLKNWPFPAGFDPEAEHTVEFRAVGPVLSVTLDGTLVGTVEDTALPSGASGFTALEGVRLRALEFFTLDPTAGTPAVPRH
jgi:hypothetical protein